MKLSWSRGTPSNIYYLGHEQTYGLVWPYEVELDKPSQLWNAKYRRASVVNPTAVGKFRTLEEAQSYCEVCYRMGVYK